MWTPGLAAILAGLIVSRRFTDFGLRPGALKYLPAAWLLPIAYSFLVYGIVWATGLGTTPSPLFLKRAAATLHLTGAGHTEIVLRAFLYISTMGLLNPGALGAEQGWRGYLFPELNRWLGCQRAALFSGIVWALWHWPMVIWGHYGSGAPLPYALLCLTIFTASSGVWFAWFRLNSGSIWPCFILHSVHNAVIHQFFDRITVDQGYGKYFTTEFGAGLALVSFAIACWVWNRSGQPAGSCAQPGESSAILQPPFAPTACVLELSEREPSVN